MDNLNSTNFDAHSSTLTPKQVTAPVLAKITSPCLKLSIQPLKKLFRDKELMHRFGQDKKLKTLKKKKNENSIALFSKCIQVLSIKVPTQNWSACVWMI